MNQNLVADGASAKVKVSKVATGNVSFTVRLRAQSKKPVFLVKFITFDCGDT
jgi:hypothetical protein